MDGGSTHGRPTEPLAGIREASELTELISELASLFAKEGESGFLLCAAGFPRGRVPKFINALAFWTDIVLAANDGVLDGVNSLARAAATQYPHNNVLQRYSSSDQIRNRRKAYKITIKVEHMTVGEIGDFLARIQDAVGDESISLEKIEKGSIILTLRMSEESAERLAELASAGELPSRTGFQASYALAENGDHSSSETADDMVLSRALNRIDISLILLLHDQERQAAAAVRSAQRISEGVRRLEGLSGLQTEILALDQRSGDNTLSVLSVLQGQMPSLRTRENVDPGGAFRCAVSAARGSVWLVMDRPLDPDLGIWGMSQVLGGHRTAMIPGEMLVVDQPLGAMVFPGVVGSLISAQKAIAGHMRGRNIAPLWRPTGKIRVVDAVRSFVSELSQLGRPDVLED